MTTLLLAAGAAAAGDITYPKTQKIDHKDNYFGAAVADPYRWLEAEDSAERAAWVEEQNKVTFGYLEKIPYREKLRERLEKLYNVPSYSAPFRRGPYMFFFKRDGLQNHAVLYIQKGIDGMPEVLLDPNQFSKDGTVRLGIFAVSNDGKYAAFGKSTGGSDWQDLFVLDLATRKQLPDHLKWVKASDASWRGSGFYYSRYPEPEAGKTLTTKNEFHSVFYHKVGTAQAEDTAVFEDKANPLRFHNVSTTESERFAVLYVSDRGKNKLGPAVFVRDDAKGEAKFAPIVTEPSDEDYTVIDEIDGKLLISTNYKSPNVRVMLCDPAKPGFENCKTLIAEQPEPLEWVTAAGGKIFAGYLKDVTTKVVVFSSEGRRESEVELPGLGTVTGFDGRAEDKDVFYLFTTMHMPPTIYRYDIATRKSTVFRQPEVAFDPGQFETTRVFYRSKDGTRIPMFLAHMKGLKLDGANPTILYGYGGFNITMAPAFQQQRIAFLEQGGIFAQACLRGGSEYGEKWHEAGMRFAKQNVFDDFIAAAEFLIEKKYTSRERLAIQGGSNGGLLVGAVMNQRPDLFRVALPAVGVMDMLRFHKFTIGWNWIAEYGSAEASEKEFKNLLAYSPLHNLRETRYPSTLITTADHDDRVVPAHSFKYAAALQEKHRGPNPVLIRIETKSGHGASNLRKTIESAADVYAFALHEMGVAPKW